MAAWQPTFDPAVFKGLNIIRDAQTGNFRIVVPEFANIAADTVAAQAARHGDRPAIVFEEPDGRLSRWTYAQYDDGATRFAVALRDLGVRPGDRVALHAGPRPETAIAHMGIYKLGAIAVTISQLSGIDTVTHVLNDSGACAIVTQDAVWAPIRGQVAKFPNLRHRILVGAVEGDEIPFAKCLETAAAGFVPRRTKAEDPALLIYTSGSTGMPKGILHAHRLLHAYRVSTAIFYNLEITEPNLVFWTPADWAWVGGLNDTVFPAWNFGHAVVCSQHRFEGEWAFEFMARHGVTHAFITPTGLKRMSQSDRPKQRYDLKLRTVFTGGEPLPGETYDWLVRELGIAVNIGYGMTEVNHMIGSSQRLRPSKPGTMGWIQPGHTVALVDDEGKPVPQGEPGEIVVSEDDPTLFLGYWGQPELTRNMRMAPAWIRTRDMAVQDDEGYIWYRGRSDDLIKSAGYRIGPAEVEEALASHPAVADCGVIGVPDPDRGAIVQACVVLARGRVQDDSLVRELQEHVKARLGAHKYPRKIVFLNELPTTSSGKVSRAELRRRYAA